MTQVSGTKRIHRAKDKEPIINLLMDDKVADSVFNQLFVRHSINPKYFQPVLIKTAHYQLWEVRGDILPAEILD